MRKGTIKDAEKTSSVRLAAQKNTLKPWSRLQVRMAMSYVIVSVGIALLLEVLLIILFFTVLTRLPYIDQGVLNGANTTAAMYALEAAVQGNGIELNPASTFQPDQPFSLADPTANAPFVVPAKSSSPLSIELTLLIAPDGHVVSSSDPAHYPTAISAYRLLPTSVQSLVRGALAGKANYVMIATSAGQDVYVAQPVWSKTRQPLGAVLVKALQPEFNGSILSAGPGLLFTAIGWIVLTAPIGTLFGFLTTRGLVRRLHRLVEASAQFAQGDYKQRVKVSKGDEIGQLESQFNQMAGQLVESIAQQKALTEQQTRLEERARLEQELRTARYIQLSLLPKEIPPLPGWQIEPLYRPAREVGGDFYDFHPLEDGRLGIVIGDATDKGVSAALLMATTCTMLRTATRGDHTPGEVLGRVNDLLAGTLPAGMFVTCFYAILEPGSGHLWYANAGHDLPYLQHCGEVAELYVTGMPLGLMPGVPYENKEITLTHGDSVLFYSDGLVEAHNEDQDMFGFPYLVSLLKEKRAGKELITFLLDKWAAFTGQEKEQEDDVTLVALQRQESTQLVDAIDGEPRLALASVSPGEEHLTPSDWQMLDEWSIPSQPGNEHLVIKRVVEAVQSLNLDEAHLEKLKTAVAEATMNAMEHGNHYQEDVPVEIQVLVSPTELAVRVRDQGGLEPVPAADEPDLDAKLAGLQSPRGWGLFLMKSMVDDMRVTQDELYHTVELILHRQGGNHATS